MKFEVLHNETLWPVEIDADSGTALVNGETIDYSLLPVGTDRWLLRSGTRTWVISNLSMNGAGMEFTLNGNWMSIKVRDEKDLLLDKLGFRVGVSGGEGKLSAPMPGKILKILRKEGDEIKLGEPVVILEAMKMENELKSPVDGTLRKIHVSEGQSVEKNILLLEIETIG
jgi:acetyl/propionyl-CoA carboxylase alpha subunit